MENLWSFLLQTLTVSLVAALLLVLKWLLQDKLSPRWQYGVWGILALRILVPAGTTRQVLLPLSLWVETWKAAIESGLTSTYIGPYDPVTVRHVLPWVTGRPASVTDWLFLLYAAGVAVWVLWYLLSYLRLRLLLWRGEPVSTAVEEQIAQVASQYGLKPCRAVAVAGLPTAFVCGIFRPVLAVPAGTSMDDKVLLHELLHLKYRDGLQNFLWCLLRALHWCNPFLQVVFRRIGNDMESLCDQRVLERLEGEERRAYGVILLSAANRRYARAPGTTSISNGGRQIARRIESIARFKRYPTGMGLVSVCIVLVLLVPTVWGAKPTLDVQDFRPNALSELPQAMAASRLYRCTTPGGALDTYAKGLLLENGVYIAAASPLSCQEELEASMRRSAVEEGWVAYHLYSGDELQYADRSQGYEIFDLRETEDGALEGWLAFGVNGFLDNDGLMQTDGEGNPITEGAVLLPIAVRKETGWVVEETGPRICTTMPLSEIYESDEVLPWERSFTAEGESGAVSIREHTVYTAGTALSVGGDLWGNVYLNETPELAATLGATRWAFFEYLPQENGPVETAGFQVAELETPEAAPEYPVVPMTGHGNASSTEGWAYAGRAPDGSLHVGYGHGHSTPAFTDSLPDRPAGYALRLYWDGEPVEELRLLEEVDHGTA